jgi:hypothetical protein
MNGNGGTLCDVTVSPLRGDSQARNLIAHPPLKVGDTVRAPALVAGEYSLRAVDCAGTVVFDRAFMLNKNLGFKIDSTRVTGKVVTVKVVNKTGADVCDLYLNPYSANGAPPLRAGHDFLAVRLKPGEPHTISNVPVGTYGFAARGCGAADKLIGSRSVTLDSDQVLELP